MRMHPHRTTDIGQGRSQPRPPHARITPWMLRHFKKQLEVVIGILLELAVGESRICTSEEIAGWAGGVSESKVSRALPVLVQLGLIHAERVIYTETGRTRWRITLLAPNPDGSYTPAGEGSDR